MRITEWGYSLYWRGELVASADDPISLFRYVAVYHSQVVAA